MKTDQLKYKEREGIGFGKITQSPQGAQPNSPGKIPGIGRRDHQAETDQQKSKGPYIIKALLELGIYQKKGQADSHPPNPGKGKLISPGQVKADGKKSRGPQKIESHGRSER